MPKRTRARVLDDLPAVVLSKIFALVVCSLQDEAPPLLLVCKAWQRPLRHSRLAPTERLRPRFSDVDLAKLAVALPFLTVIDLDYSHKVTGLQSLAAMTSLQQLDLAYSENITDEGLQHLAAHLPGLERLYLGDYRELGDPGFCSSITNARHAVVEHPHWSEEAVLVLL